jgi:hypothetical protein
MLLMVCVVFFGIRGLLRRAVCRGWTCCDCARSGGRQEGSPSAAGVARRKECRAWVGAGGLRAQYVSPGRKRDPEIAARVGFNGGHGVSVRVQHLDFCMIGSHVRRADRGVRPHRPDAYLAGYAAFAQRLNGHCHISDSGARISCIDRQQIRGLRPVPTRRFPEWLFNVTMPSALSLRGLGRGSGAAGQGARAGNDCFSDQARDRL